CRFPGHDGVQRGTENSACIFWNAPSFQHETHVPVAPATDRGMSASRQLRDSRVSRLCWLGLVVATRVGFHRNVCGHDFCGQSAVHVRASSRSTGGLVMCYNVRSTAISWTVL